MGLFRKQRKLETLGTISNRMTTYLEQKQRKLADLLNRKTANISRQGMLFGLIIFCTAFGGYLLYLLLDTFGAFN